MSVIALSKKTIQNQITIETTTTTGILLWEKSCSYTNMTKVEHIISNGTNSLNGALIISTNSDYSAWLSLILTIELFDDVGWVQIACNILINVTFVVVTVIHVRTYIYLVSFHRGNQIVGLIAMSKMELIVQLDHNITIGYLEASQQRQQHQQAKNSQQV